MNIKFINLTLSIVGVFAAAGMVASFVGYSYFFAKRIRRKLKKSRHYDKRFLDTLFLITSVAFIPYSMFLFDKAMDIVRMNFDKW